MDFEEKIIQALLDGIEEAGSARKFAAQNNFSNTYISAVVHRKTKPSTRLMNVLGFDRKTEIVQIGD